MFDTGDELTQYATGAGAAIYFYQTVEDVTDELVDEFVEQAGIELRQRWNRGEQLTRQAIENNIDELNDFLKRTLRIPEQQFATGKVIKSMEKKC